MTKKSSVSVSQLFLIVFLILTVGYLFQPTFSAYFFQDDWFSLLISKAKNIREVLGFFLPRNDVIYYRPLGMQLPFFVFQTLFGLNPLPFKIATFTIHLINGFLVYRLLKFLLKDQQLASFGAIFYLTSATHLIIFYWAATFAFVLAPFFYFLSFLLFVFKRRRLSFLVFILGLTANELLITLPLILTIWLIKSGELRSKWRQILPHWLAELTYLGFRTTLAKPPTSEGYTFLTSVHQFFLNLRNYLLWAFNWPDEINGQFVSFWKLNPQFVVNFHTYFTILVVATFVFLLFMIGFPIFLRFKKRSTVSTPQLSIWGSIWFIITLSPVLYFAKHYFSYYLPIPLFGLILFSLAFFTQATDNLISKRLRNGILFLVLAFWYIAAFSTVRTDIDIHWAPRRAKISKALSVQIKKFFPQLPPNALVLLANSDETKWALGEENALKVLYDPSIHTYYGNQEAYLKTTVDEIPRQIFKLP